VITTNAHINPAKVEPKKLGIVTTAQLPTPEPEPITRGSDLSKMITTHDERDVEDHSKSNKLLNDVLLHEATDEAAQAGLNIAPKKKAKPKKSA
jgi:hypothetical protein